MGTKLCGRAKGWEEVGMKVTKATRNPKDFEVQMCSYVHASGNANDNKHKNEQRRWPSTLVLEALHRPRAPVMAGNQIHEKP
jgi:hypothetical protein